MGPLRRSITLFTLALFTVDAVQSSNSSDSHYVAAVVEYSPGVDTGLDALDNMLDNIKALGTFMANASSQGADILVFPEDGLVGDDNTAFLSIVPNASASINPCLQFTNESEKPLHELSCQARRYKMYLVVNLDEKYPCSSTVDNKCPSTGYYHYNTNVVFNREGTVIARYRKWHLFGETGKQRPPTIEYVTFDTDFGVKFGTFTCFDIIYEKPPLILVRDMGVTDIVFPNAWFSEVPYLSTLQIHGAWAHSQNVNLLSAGYNYPAEGSTGSGIFRGRNGPIQTVFTGEKESVLIVKPVPKKGYWGEGDADPSLSDVFNPAISYAGVEDPYVEMSKVEMLQDHLYLFSTKLLTRPDVGEEIFVNETLCNRGLCCMFSVSGRGLRLSTAMSSAANSIHGSPLRYIFSSEESSFNLTEAELLFNGFYYRLAVFQGVRSNSGVATDGVQVCSVISCLNKDLASCGWIAKGLSSPKILWTEFDNITISASFNGSRLVMADTEAGPRYSVMPPSSFYFDVKNHSSGYQHANIYLQRSVLDLRTLSLYSRVFEWDGFNATTVETK